MDELTKKQKGFVKDYIETGNATKAVLNNYDTDSEEVAGVIGSQNLGKLKVQNAIKSIAEQIPDELLVKKHLGLLEQRQLSYFVFSKALEDEEIEQHMLANGLDLIVIRESDKGKMAFYSIDDAQAIKAGLEMSYKLKGSYAPEKRDITTDGEKLPSADLDKLAEVMAEQLKQSKI